VWLFDQISVENKIAKEINWGSEPIVAPRHLISREEYQTSEKFINDKLGKGYNSWPGAILRGIQIFCSKMYYSFSSFDPVTWRLDVDK